MPKIVDHDVRRAEIINGLVRVAARDGLHTVTMRAVAAEAGVSLRLVQYYFETKSQLMHAALEKLELESNQRWAARIPRSSPRPSARRILEAFLSEALPTDEQSRAFHLVWMSYAVLAMTDAKLAQQPFVEGPINLERRLADILRQGQSDGELAADMDVELEAASLLTFSHGLGTTVLVGQRTPEAATEVLRYRLNRLFGMRPATSGVN